LDEESLLILEDLGAWLATPCALLFNKDDFIKVSGGEFPKDLIAESAFERGHTRDHDDGSEPTSLRIGELVVLF
jgi:hypothetical protein